MDIKKYVSDTMSNWVGKGDRKARKPYITEEISSKMDERRKWKTVNNEEGTPIKRLRNKLTEPQTRLQCNIFSPYVTKSWNFKEHDDTI